VRSKLQKKDRSQHVISWGWHGAVKNTSCGKLNGKAWHGVLDSTEHSITISWV
jgi:hypothetical protein